MMRRIKEYIFFTPFLFLALLIGFAETIAGKSFEDEWLKVHDWSQRNHGQGSRKGR